MEKNESNTSLIKQPNTITLMHYKDGYNAVQLKIINAIVKTYQSHMTVNSKIEFNGCVIPSFRIDYQLCGSNKVAIYEAAQELLSNRIEFTDLEPATGKLRRTTIAPFTACSVIKDSPYLDISIDKAFLPALFSFCRGFTLYNPKVVERLTNKYSIRLYECFCSNADKVQLSVTKSWLVKWLSIPDACLENSELKKLLLKAIKKLNEDEDNKVKCNSIDFSVSDKAREKAKSKGVRRPEADTITFNLENSTISKPVQAQIDTKKWGTLMKTLIHCLKLNPVQLDLVESTLRLENKQKAFMDRFYQLWDKMVGDREGVERKEGYTHFANTIAKVLREDYKVKLN